MRKILCLTTVLCLSACATGPHLASRMATYTGASAETLVKDLGVPDKKITLDGVQYFAYDQYHTVITPGFTPGFYAFGGYSPFYAGPFYDGGFPSTVTQAGCETTFTLRDNKVVSFTLRGNDCG